MAQGLPVVVRSLQDLLGFPSILLRSWKGDYLHRPDSPHGVTTWDAGIGNAWIPCPGPNGTLMLRSWKGDYLHRPDSPQGVTTWDAGIGNQWTIEPNGETFRLKSWKGDYLHRPDSPQGVTTWDTGIGNEWHPEELAVVTPWTGGEIADGTRIVIKTTSYDIGLRNDSGSAPFSSAVAALPWQWHETAPMHDYVMAMEPATVAGSVFTLRTWPRVDREFMPSGEPNRYQKIILQLVNGRYLTLDSSGTYHASASQDEARVLCLDLTRGNRTMLYDVGYQYGQRASRDPTLGMDLSGVCTARFAKPSPSQPVFLKAVQGIDDSAVIEILVMTPASGSTA